jgi:glycosyltransferase involved in cell wall biosynthesis
VWSFERYYRQKAIYQETIAIPKAEYKPNNGNKRGDRFLTIGRMSPDKGNLNAGILCKNIGVPLDIVGGRGCEQRDNPSLTAYEQDCRNIADGEMIKFLGEVSDEQKIELMQTCKGLIYATSHTEITSHKVQECMFCGAPVILPNLGGLPEICTHGINGYLCSNEQEYTEAIKNVDKLEPMKLHKEVVDKYSVDNVVKNYVELYEKVANGLRWK